MYIRWQSITIQAYITLKPTGQMNEHNFIKALSEDVLMRYTFLKLFWRTDLPEEVRLAESEEIVMDAWNVFFKKMDKYAHLWEHRDQPDSRRQIIYVMKNIIGNKCSDWLRSKKYFLKYKNDSAERVVFDQLLNAEEPSAPSDRELLQNSEIYLAEKGLKPKDLHFMMFHLQGIVEGYSKDELLALWNKGLQKTITLAAYNKKLQRIRQLIEKKGGKRHDLYFIFIFPAELSVSFGQQVERLGNNHSSSDVQPPNTVSMLRKISYLKVACLSAITMVLTGASHSGKTLEQVPETVSKQEKVWIELPRELPKAVKTAQYTLEPKRKITDRKPKLKSPEEIHVDINHLDSHQDQNLKPLVGLDVASVLLKSKPIEPENQGFKIAEIQAINLNPQTVSIFETNGDWQRKLATIEPLKNSYVRQEKRYQKLDIKVAEFIAKYRNKERQIGNSNSKGKHGNNKISTKANRLRKGQGTSKKDKVRNRRLAQRKRNQARRRGRKVVAWRKEMREANKEMQKLQKEAIRKTLVLLVGNTHEYKTLGTVNQLNWKQVEGVMVGFALPKAPKEQLLFNLYQYDKSADNPKQLLVNATLQADAQGVVKQFVPLNQDFLLGKKGHFIIEITLKPKKYREKRLISRSFQVGK